MTASRDRAVASVLVLMAGLSGCATSPPVRPGGSGATPAAASSSAPAALSIRVQGNRFVDGAGTPVQLRGVNISGLETVAAQGWSPSDPWGGTKPHFQALAAWKINAVRLPLNEASWLGYTCTDASNRQQSPDPGGNYKQTVAQTVAQATAARFYVILDLHWSSPGSYCAMDQNPMADADHSPAFWTQVSATFKDNTAVLFELFNEPFLPPTPQGWSLWLDGGTYTQLRYPKNLQTSWQVAGMQQLIDAVRQTGAGNVILVGGLAYSNDLSGWPTHTPRDPLGQLAAAWHVYSSNPYTDVRNGGSAVGMLAAVNARVPLAITEIGDVDGPGANPTLAPQILPFADSSGYSYFGWTWNVWNQSSNDLILDPSGRPTQGFGTYFKQHLICRATSATCE